MSDGGSAAAGAERASDGAWEPPDKARILRRRRRSSLAFVALLILLVVLVFPLFQVLVLERPIRWTTWVWAAWALLLGWQTWRSHFTARGRAEWERATIEELRVEHALRHHVSIGAEERPLVTARAQRLDAYSGLAVFGYPVLVVVAAAFVVEADASPAQVTTAVCLAVVVFGLLLLRSLRRGRMGTRWLADPLPRDEEAP